MKTSAKNLSARIQHLKPCNQAIEWLDQQESPTQAWLDCHRGDWMLWLIGSQITSEPWSDDRKPLLACCLDVAETVKHLWQEIHANKIESAIAVLRSWIDGKAALDEAKQARQYLSAADADAAYASVYYVFNAAAYATAVFDNTSNAAAYAAYAYASAASAVYDTAYDAAKTKSLSESANIVRKYFPEPPKIK